MFWNPVTCRWEKHPDCHCDRDPCVCRWLRPLDDEGHPLPYVIFEALSRGQA